MKDAIMQFNDRDLEIMIAALGVWTSDYNDAPVEEIEQLRNRCQLKLDKLEYTARKR